MSKTRYGMFFFVVVLTLSLVGIAVAKDSTPPLNSGINSVSTDYGWSQTTGTYEEITGGTQLTTSCDDDSYNGISLPFTFSFNNAPYTSVSIQCNGFIAMGLTVSSSYTPISSGSSNNVVAALGSDQQTNLADSEIRYETLGASPDQVFVIQWKNFRHYGATGDLYNFQIRLYETSNVVEVVYGAFTQNATNRTEQVGLRGNSNTDFNNRKSTTDWLSSVAGTLNSDTMALTTAYVPPSGLTWTWTPIAPHPVFDTSYKVAPTDVVIGDPIPYTIHIINSGNADANASLMSDPIPPGTTYNDDVSCSDGTCFYNPGLNQVEWEGAVPMLAEVTISFSVISADVPCGIPVINEATIDDPGLYAGPITRSASTRPVASLPDPLDGFEVSVPPPGWTETIVNDPGTDPDWSQESVGTYPTISPHGGGFMAKFNSFNAPSGASDRLWTGALDLTGYDSPEVVFWMSHDTGYSGNADYLQIQVSTDGVEWTDVGTPVLRYDASCTTACWKEHIVSLSGYNLQEVYIGFLGVSAYGNNFYLDDVGLADFDYPCAGPDINVDPTSLTQTLPQDQQATQTLNICNTGDSPLTWSLSEVPGFKVSSVVASPAATTQPGHTVELNVGSQPGNGAKTNTPIMPDAALPLVLDDGSYENSIGVNDATNAYQFIWLNRFTPAPADFPFNLTQIQVLFPSGQETVGDAIDLVVYQDADGDPTNGAEWLATYNVTVQATDGLTWSVYDLASPLYVSGPGDVLIGVIDRFVVSGVTLANFPAAIDQTATQMRSWIGWWNLDPPDPAILPPDAVFAIVDSFGLPGNWLVRGLGETIESDIPWLSEDPTSGTVMADECQAVSVTFDSTGLNPGDYTGDLDVASNDFDEPLVVVPVTLTVTTSETPIFSQSSKLAPANVTVGDTIHYSVEVLNTGGAPGLATTMSDLVPPGTTYVPDSLICDSGTCTYDEGTNTVSWFGQVGAGGMQQNGAGVDEIIGSTVNYISPDTFSSSGITTDLCFNVTQTSTDEEYLDGFDFDLPDDWTVNNVIDVPATSGCGNDHTFGVDAGNVVYWYTNGMPSGCGDWMPGTYDFCANVTVPAGCSAGWDFPWNIWGDNWGVPPHSMSGSSAAACGEPTLPNPVTIEFDVVAESCPAAVVNTAVIFDQAAPAPVEVSATTDVACISEPDISVSPLFLTQTLLPNESASQDLTIGNVGDADLDWSIAEIPGALSVPNTAVPAAGSGSNSISEDKAFSVPAPANVLRNSEANLLALINDGSFENGPPPASAWTEVSDQPCEWIGDWSVAWGLPAFDGLYDYWGGGYCGGIPTTSHVSQSVSVPTGNVTLSFWYVSYRPSADDADPDIAYVSVDGTNVWTLDLVQANNTYPNFVNVTIDISAYAGQQVTLEFGAVSSGTLTGNIRFDYIEFIGGQPSCDNPIDIPWLSEDPASGTTPAASQTPVAVTFDSTGLTPGTYNANLCVLSNDPDEPVIEVPVTLTVEGQPAIVVSPLSLDATVLIDASTTLPLSIGNEGDIDLDWELFDSSLVATWSDNFDGYPTGQQMHGADGWKGWDNNAAAGALTSDTQSLSSPNSVAILGASDLTHPYAGYTSGVWTYTAWQYIPDDFSGTSYFILLNTYNDGGPYNWSLQVSFDSATNLVTNEGPVGGTLPLIKGQWIQLRDEIDLTADTQSVYYGDDLLFTGSWRNGMSGGGAANIANVDLFANDATVVYYDDISLSHLDDTLWLTEDPASGTTAPGDTSPVDVVFDATGLTAGVYHSTIFATSNDPVTPLVTIPVTMTVIAPSADLSIVKDYYPMDVAVGETFTYTLEVTNFGPQPATNVVVEDTLPPEVSFVSSVDCTENLGLVTCDIGDLGVDESMTVTFQVLANQEGTAVNTGSVSSDVFDPNMENNTSTVETPIFVRMHYFYLPIMFKN